MNLQTYTTEDNIISNSLEAREHTSGLRSRTEAGGVFNMKVKLLSYKGKVSKTYDANCDSGKGKKEEDKKSRAELRTDVVDCNFHRNDMTGLVGGSSVVILTESHNIDTLGSKSRANGRSRCSLPNFKSQLYNSNHCTHQTKNILNFR